MSSATPHGYYLRQGDCLELLKTIPDNFVDLVLADPPYGTTACKWDSIIPLEPMWEQLKRVTKKNAAIVMTASQPFTSLLGASNLRMLKYSWCWDKLHATGHLNAKKRPRKGYEDILVFYQKQPTYNPQGLVYAPKKMYNSRSHCARGATNVTSTVSGGMNPEPYIQQYTNYPDGFIHIKSANGNSAHPTQKPVALMEYLIKTYTVENQVVVDFTMGSGTTGVACGNLNRKFIGFERDEKYFEMAKSRIEAAYVPA